MRQKDRIIQFLELNTIEQLKDKDRTEMGFNALDLSIDLQINRANVSKELNQLWREGDLIKIDGRPTYFVPLSVVKKEYPDLFFSGYYLNMDSFLQNLKNDEIIDHETITDPYGFLNEQQKKLFMALSYPLNGYPPLLQLQDGINGYQFVYEVYESLNTKNVFDKPLTFKFIDCSQSKAIAELSLFDINKPKSKSKIFYFIHNVQLLPEAMLIQLNRFFVNQRWLPSHKNNQDKFVIGLPASYDPSFVNTFSFVIMTPPFTELSMAERLNTIINSFKNHAKKLNRPIRIQRELFKAFCINQIESNYLVIENDITQALIKAHFRSLSDNRSSCTLLWSDFSFPLIHESIPKHTSLNIIDSFFDETIQFDENGTSKIDYIYNQPIINELNTLILKTDYDNQDQIKRMIERFTKRVKRALHHELHALTIHAGYSKFNRDKTHGKEKEIGFDFLTTQLNTLDVKNFNPQYVEFIREYYTNQFNQNETFETGLLLIIDSRHHEGTYEKILKMHSIPSHILSLRTPITIDELSKTLDYFSTNTDIVIATDINIYKNIESLLRGVTSREVISYFPLSLPLLEDLIDKIEKKITLEELRKEKQRYIMGELESSQPFDDEENQFLNHLVDRFLSNQLSFLDANKAVAALYPILGNILNTLKLSYTKQFVVKFIVHSAFVIERCIKKEYLEYPDLNRHIKENGDYFNIIQKEFVPVEELFGITIPLSEIAYIADIFSQN